MTHSNALSARERQQRAIDAAISFGLTGRHESTPYTEAEVDAMIAFVGRKVDELREVLDEAEALAAAGERVGYESAYRILRRGVRRMLEVTGDAF